MSSGIADAEYTIGAEYINMRITKVIANLTSRNLIAKAESHKPTPVGMSTISKTISGKKAMFQVNGT